MSAMNELYLELKDEEWPFTYTDHDRQIVRAIVFDDAGWFYFVRVQRDDHFGKATLIETSGGGVEKGEDLLSAIHRELQEELGAQVEVVAKLGVVSDYYNLIHRHNINHYYLCRVTSFGEKHLMPDEIEPGATSIEIDSVSTMDEIELDLSNDLDGEVFDDDADFSDDDEE